MPDRTLSEETVALRDAVRTWSEKEVAPAVGDAELRDGHLTVPEGRALFEGAAELGLLAMMLPEEHGGTERSHLDLAVVMEEIGVVDVGVAGALNLTMCVPAMVVAGGTDDQRRRWLDPLGAGQPLVVAGALNEPDVPGSEMFNPDPDPAAGTRTKAVRDGDDYVITGTKAGWVSNAGLADVYLVFARTDATKPAVAGTSAFWVPADAPGLVVGGRTEMLGMRSTFHADLALSGVRVPEADRVGPQDGGLALMQTSTAGMVIGLAASFVGLARAASDLALAWSAERVSWGKPVRQHQAVALMLADNAVEVRQARLVVADAAMALDDVMAGRGDPAELAVVLPAAKTVAVDAAIACAERAVKVLGGAGVTRGSVAEKLLRDAWTGYSCDFTREVLRLGIAMAL